MKNEKIVVSKTAHSQRLKSFRMSAALMLTTLMLVVAATTGATAQTFTTFDAPGAGTGAYEGTFGGGINTAGVIAGYYIDGGIALHGFVRAANGKITTFSVKKAGAYQGTFGITINTAGAIAGEYLDANNVFHGFVRAANGTITTFNVKKAGTGTYQGTVGGAINTAGVIAGRWFGPARGSTFLYAKRNTASAGNKGERGPSSFRSRATPSTPSMCATPIQSRAPSVVVCGVCRSTSRSK